MMCMRIIVRGVWPLRPLLQRGGTEWSMAQLLSGGGALLLRRA
jgi:hypothetical protein